VIKSYGYATGEGNELTRGLQLTRQQARQHARELAKIHGYVEMWEEGRSADTLEAFEAEVSE
jgi:hypothetical protein